MGKSGNGEGSIYKRSSDGRWVGQVTVGFGPTGRQLRKTVTAKTRARVVEKLRELQRTLDAGLPAPDPTLTVTALLDLWMEVLRVDPSAVANYESHARLHIKPILGRKTVKSLTVADVDRLISAKLKEGKSVSTVRRVRSVLAQAIDYGVLVDLVARNVAKMSTPPKMRHKEGRCFSVAELKKFRAALVGDRYEALFATMLGTGIRRGEALGLTWDDLDLRRKILYVRRQLVREDGKLVTKRTKTKSSARNINLPAYVVKVLKVRKATQVADALEVGPAWQASGFVFTTGIGTPIDSRNVGHYFQTVCTKAGIRAWRPHELRHSAASMLANGVPIQVVSETLGHSSIRMTVDTYGHVLPPQRQEAADAMDRAWSAAFAA